MTDLKAAVFTVLEGWALPLDARKILETAYYAQPEQEPVAWMVLTQDDKKLMLWGQEKPPIFDAPVKLIPLYTAPPKREWVGLTDDEIEHLRNDQPWWMVRDIEAKLKEKNT